MKTNLFIAALSLVVLAGCSSEDEIDTLVSKSDNAITFGTYVGKQTKALDKSAFAKDDKFGVSAYYGDGTFEANFMSNETISTTDGSTWTYTNTKYWPEGNPVSFVAYYPNLTTAPTIADGATAIPFTVESDATKQVDFMWSTLKMIKMEQQSMELQTPQQMPQAFLLYSSTDFQEFCLKHNSVLLPMQV